MADFNPSSSAAQTFQNLFGRSEVSPLGSAGTSHFGYVQPLNVGTHENAGWHVTTQVPGLRQGLPISIHTPFRTR